MKFDLCRYCNINKLFMINNIIRVILGSYYSGLFNCGSRQAKRTVAKYWAMAASFGEKSALQFKHN